MLVYSNEASGETITLQFYDNETDMVYDVDQTYDFVSDMVLGNVVAPEQLTLSVPMADDGGDDCASGVYDCAGECDGTAVEDCAGTCGGDAVVDECGVCNGSGIADGACDCDGNVEDCAGSCGGDAVVDECGLCNGPGIADGACDCNGNVEDCAGTCGGDAVVDECGVCDGDGSSCGGNISVTDGCDLPDGSVFILSNGDVLYNVSTDIAGFQFNVDGTTVSGASGGAAAGAGFTVSAGGSTVLAFSFTGATIADDCGLLTSLALAGEATGLSGLVFSDSAAATIEVVYCQGCVEGGGDDCASGVYAVSYTHLTLPTILRV